MPHDDDPSGRSTGDRSTGRTADDTEGGLDVGLGVASVARRLGIAPGTLRTWDRRYGVGPSRHESGSHRRYTSADLARLTLMRRLMLEGVSPSDAAGAALHADLRSPDAATPLPSLAPRDRSPRSSRRSRAGGGRVVALRDATPAARGLARAAMSLDSAACLALVNSSLDERGVLRTWEELIVPVVRGVARRRRGNGDGAEVEQLLAESVEDGLRAATRRLARPLNSRPVLVAALEPEEHRLPLHALAAALAERSVAVRMLGPRLPAAALTEAVARTGAAAVVLWSEPAPAPAAGAMPLRGRGGGRPAVELPALRSEPVLVLGGDGWPVDRRPPRGLWLKDLAETVDAVTAAVGVDMAAPR